MAECARGTASIEAPAAPQQSNILLYGCDQMRTGFVPAFGQNSKSQTLNLDKMVQRSSSFRYAVTNQPLCSPSRACMI